MQVSVVTFTRDEGSAHEEGIAVSKNDNVAGDVDVIIDSEGKVVETIWSYQAKEFEGCFNVKLKRKK